jgi:DNA-binding GntR family transcriptional regulator
MGVTRHLTGDTAPAPRTAEALAVREIREAIVRGELAPGERIRQQATARAVGVSLIPLREALKTLAGEGAVSYVPQRGYQVSALQIADIARICALRDVLESEAERIAVPLLDEADVAVLRRCLLALLRAVEDHDPVAIVAANRRLHFAIFDRCANPWLLDAISRPWDALEPYRVLALRRPQQEGEATSTLPEIVREHRQIVKALAKGKHVRALALLSEHRQRSEGPLRRAVAAQSG